jgi:hypothetical protein
LCSPERLEERFDLVVTRTTMEHASVNVGACSACESFEEIGDQFRLEISHKPRCHSSFHNRAGTAAQVDCDDAQGFVHGHHEIPSPQNPATLAQRAIKCLSQGGTHVFDRVVLIHIEVTCRTQRKVESTVTCE